MPMGPAHLHQASSHRHTTKYPEPSQRIVKNSPGGGFGPTLKNNNKDQHRNVHWDLSTVDNESKMKYRSGSPIPGPEPLKITAPRHLHSEYSNVRKSLAHPSFAPELQRARIGDIGYPSTLDPSIAPVANTSRPIDPVSSRDPYWKEASYGPVITSVKIKTSSSVQRKSHGHQSSRTDSMTSESSTKRRASGCPTPANSSSKRDPSKLGRRQSQTSRLKPPVPDAPQMLKPPPTPRPARLPTPDLEEIGDRKFCCCCNVACDGREYPHDCQGRRLSSKMSEQMQTAQAYMIAMKY